MKTSKGKIILLAFLAVVIVALSAFGIIRQNTEKTLLRNEGVNVQVQVEDLKEEVKPVGKGLTRHHYVTYTINNVTHREDIGLDRYKKLTVGETITVCHAGVTARYDFPDCAA